jgi:hypothetical protein
VDDAVGYGLHRVRVAAQERQRFVESRLGAFTRGQRQARAGDGMQLFPRGIEPGRFQARRPEVEHE